MDYAFYNCRALTTVTFNAPYYINSAKYAFYGCNNLTALNFTNSSYASYMYNFHNAFKNCTNLTEVKLDECKIINIDAFAYCYNLSSINCRFHPLR